MPVGKVKWFDVRKGYGFIQPEDGAKDVFVHITAVEKAGLDRLVENQKVEYQISTEKGKTSAVDLKVRS